MDDRPTLFEIPWLRLFPWLRLLRAPGAAVDLKRLTIAVVGLVALEAGWGVLDRIIPGIAATSPIGVFAWGGETPSAAEPFNRLSDPFVRLFQAPVHYAALARNALAALWAVAVWGLCGGAITRIAAVEQATREKLGLKAAGLFTVKHAGTLMGAPLVPLVAVIVVALPVAAFGLLYRLGDFGRGTAGVLAFVPLAAGLIMTFLLLGLAAGWPLMIASAAVEGEDSFDAMSRTYAYIRQRPWHYVGYAAITLIVGSLAWFFVELFARSVVHLAYWSLSLTAPATPLSLQPSGLAIDYGHAFWLGFVGLVARGWIYSYFWTAATTIYLLLRRDVDGTPLNVIGGTDAQTVPPTAVAPPVATVVHDEDEVANV
jgi:hypothetical protein